MQRGICDEIRNGSRQAHLPILQRAPPTSSSPCGVISHNVKPGTMAFVRAWRIGAAAVVLVALYADVEALNSTALDARLPAISVGHFDPSKYALPLPSNATSASGEGDASTGSTICNTIVHRAYNHLPPSSTVARHILYPSCNRKDGHALDAGVEGAKIESAAPSPRAGLASNSSNAYATIEAVPGFVKTQGQQFSLNGRGAYFAGTNAW